MRTPQTRMLFVTGLKDLLMKGIHPWLCRAHNGNTRKELIIAEMKLKVDGLRIEEANMRTKLASSSQLIKSFNHDFYQLTQLIQVIY